MRLPKLLFVLVANLFWLAGCALHPFSAVTPGMTREEVIGRMGHPGAVVAIPQGTRLQYSG